MFPQKFKSTQFVVTDAEIKSLFKKQKNFEVQNKDFKLSLQRCC